MDDDLTSSISAAPQEALVEIVMLAHRQGRRGDKGGWEEFLNTCDNSSLTNPARRTRETLIAFLLSFTEEEDLKRLVRCTLKHPSYLTKYEFPSYDKDWMVTKLTNIETLMKSSEIIAIDCQTVLCKDGTYSLARVCVVDRNLQVKLDEKVNPLKPVADYRTKITGITAADLGGVSYSLADAQIFMKKLLEKGAILVGHGLHDALLALRLDYARVIDTSFIFGQFDGRPPSLETLCKSVLGYEVCTDGAPHNCVDDARAAMRLVLAKIERGVDNEIVLNQVEVLEDEMGKLQMNGRPIERKRALESKDLPDPQKLKSYECCDPFEEFDKWVERYEEEDDNLLNVRKKEHRSLLDQFSEMYCLEEVKTDKCGDPVEEFEIMKEKFEEEDDNHLIEIERLKKGIRDRDFQISAQDKIINNLRMELEEMKAKMKKGGIPDFSGRNFRIMIATEGAENNAY